MPDQTLDQLAEETVPQDADLLYIIRAGLDRRINRAVLLQGMVGASRTVATPAGAGLTGGGALSNNLSLSVDIPGLTEDTTPDPAVDMVMTYDGSAGALRKVLLSRITGNSQPNSFASVAVAGQSSVIADSSADTITLAPGAGIALTTNSVTDTVTIATTGLASATRAINAGAGLAGGGDLTADRSLAINIAGQSEDLAPDLTNDYVMSYKGATGALRKIKLSLLGGSSYTLPTATATVLGGIKLGTGLTSDGNGVVSAVSTYSLPPATSAVIGGVRPGTGLSVTAAGILNNTNPTPYILPPATVNTIGGVKPGQGVSIAADGTLDVVGGGGTTVSDGAYRPESYGAIRGLGLTLSQRQTNTQAINACWAAAGDAGARVDMGGGTFEVSGVLNITRTGQTILGDRCSIVQYLSGVHGVAATSVSLLTLKGIRIGYGATQSTGDDPTSTETYQAGLKLTAVTGSYFENITVAGGWVGFGISGSTGSHDNTFINCRASVVAGNSHGIVYKSGSGSTFIGCGVTGNGATKSIQGGLFLSAVTQCQFTQLRLDNLSCRKPFAATACQSISLDGTVFDALTLVGTGNFGGVVFAASDTGLNFSGSVVRATGLSTANSLTDASIFVGEQGADFTVTNLFVSATVKVGAVRLALLGHTSASAARSVTGTFRQVRLDTRADTPHRLDDLCYATVDSAGIFLDGPLLGYNNLFGAASAGYFALPDAAATAYPALHGRTLRLDTPLSANRTVTLPQYIDAAYANATLNAPRVPRGTIIEVVRTANSTGSSVLTVASHTGGTLTTLATNSAARFIFDGSAFTLIPGSVSSGGSGGTFATQAEAVAGVSATTYMSPVRTKDAITGYASSNEVGGAYGEVVGFNSSGIATAVKNTRVMVITALAEDTAVAALAGARKLMVPIGLQVSSVTVYTPTTGTTATTVDLNLNGTSMLTAPVTVAANTASTTTTSFSNATITKNTILTIDIDAAGTGAKGLQVTISGVEI